MTFSSLQSSLKSYHRHRSAFTNPFLDQDISYQLVPLLAWTLSLCLFLSTLLALVNSSCHDLSSGLGSRITRSVSQARTLL